MKIKNLITLMIIVFATTNIVAQQQNYCYAISQNSDGTYYYMRSSLEMVYIDGGSFPKKELVDKSWENYMDPQKNFPNQYNKHYAGVGNVEYTGSEISNAQMTTLITDYVSEKKIANKLIQRWFNYNPNGVVAYDYDNPMNPDAKINMSTIFERGYYNINAGDENVMLEALKRDRESQIKDLSMKLLPFTFLTFTKLDFYENEPVARAVRDAAIVTAKNVRVNSIKNGVNPQMADLIYNVAVGVAATAYAATKDGYTLHSTTWLYRLNWDENIEAYFNRYVIENPELLETSSRFSMQYIDCQENKSTVVLSVARSQAEIVNLAVMRNLNKVFMDLQDRNDVFKVWTPLLDFYSLVSPSLTAPITVEDGVITAKIGTKEGLRGGERFSIVDEDGNFYGFAEAKKGMVWDNDDDAGVDAACYYEPQTDKNGNIVKFTTFKGIKAKKATTGMYICDPQAPKKMRVAARIGTKEGVGAKDKYAVYLYDATTQMLNKVGTVKPTKGKIWDNIYYNSNYGNDLTINKERNGNASLKSRDKDGLRTTETLFKGTKKIKPGMFIRKIK